MYQPELGRFLQPDPKHFAAGDYNLYRYCHNDPINKRDPTGLAPIVVDEASDIFAQRASQNNLQAYANSFWPQEFGTAVNRDASGNLTLNGPIADSWVYAVLFMRDAVPLEKFVSGRTIIITHNHTNEKNWETKSYLSWGDILVGNQTGKPVYVITPSGQEDRYRPSDKGTAKGRMNNPGVIERRTKGKWVPVAGANPDVRTNPKLKPELWQ